LGQLKFLKVEMDWEPLYKNRIGWHIINLFWETDKTSKLGILIVSQNLNIVQIRCVCVFNAN